MATLKEHQQAMVELLANGSGIPASASRLAHAMHDVLNILMIQSAARKNASEIRALFGKPDGVSVNQWLNGSFGDESDIPEGPFTKPERRVKELENTVKQLREQCQTYRKEIALLKMARNNAEPEQAGCRKEDTQVRDCDDDDWIQWGGGDCPVSHDAMVIVRLRDGTEYPAHPAKSYTWDFFGLGDIVAYRVVEEAKPECKHDWIKDIGSSYEECCKCGEVRK